MIKQQNFSSWIINRVILVSKSLNCGFRHLDKKIINIYIHFIYIYILYKKTTNCAESPNLWRLINQMFIKSLPHHSEILTLHILRLFFPALLLLCFFFLASVFVWRCVMVQTFSAVTLKIRSFCSSKSFCCWSFSHGSMQNVYVYIYILVYIYTHIHSVIDWLLFALQWSHKLIPLNWLPLCCVPVSMTPYPTCEPSSCWPIRAEISQWS